MAELLQDGTPSTPRLLLAHGAGAPMDSDFMSAIAERIASAGIQVIRFEFGYMAKCREDGQKRGPDRAPKLIARFHELLARVGPPHEVVIGGKSMGGRIASMIADEAGVAGVCCLGYPFHPPGKPERLRTAHLEAMQTSTLIVQGTRDRFGTEEEVATYRLSDAIELAWMEDGDHSFKPRKKSGRSLEQNLDDAARAVVAFIRRCEATG
ncbi:MAG: alpha/beta fold hydrolase [Polyangiales bacterium]|jgi:predicted alpha/beta-hydrolase family hydrolase